MAGGAHRGPAASRTRATGRRPHKGCAGLLRRHSGIDFHLKTFRATFGQQAIDNGAAIQDVSRALRHSTTLTTERYYARVRADDALGRIRKARAQATSGLIDAESKDIERRRADSNRRPPD